MSGLECVVGPAIGLVQRLIYFIFCVPCVVIRLCAVHKLHARYVTL
jgi:hypothetical protein